MIRGRSTGVLVACYLASCTPASTGGGAPRDVSSPATDAETDAGVSTTARTLGERDDGARLALGRGATLAVELPSNPTTGYDWSVVEAPAALGAPETTFLAPGTDADGAPGRRRFTWRMSAELPPGEHAVVLGYRRAFEGDKPPLRSFRVTVSPAR